MQIVTRAEARAVGARHYFTGRPCPRGHLAPRFTSAMTCSACSTENMRATRTRDPERNKMLKADFAVRHPGYDRQHMARWRASHPGHSARAQHEAYWRDPEKRRAHSRAWQRANSDKARALVARRRARVKGVPGTFTASDVRTLFIAQEGICAACPADLSIAYDIDHKIPVSRPGSSNWPSNLQLLCPTCNRSKGAKTMEEWLCS